MNNEKTIHRFVLYCDESLTSDAGLRYHHYFGGLLVSESHIDRLGRALNDCLMNSTSEMKWQKVDDYRMQSFLNFMEVFFDQIALGNIKIRVMFLDKYLSPQKLSKEQYETKFQRLYYTFISRAFGWRHSATSPNSLFSLRIFMDQLPDKHVKNRDMKRFLSNMPSTRAFSGVRLQIPNDGISEIDSRNHRLLQALDILIGSLGFRMNKLHEARHADGKKGNRTKAKEELYKYIQKRLNALGVKNIGITTGKKQGLQSLWLDSVRIWRLEPREFSLDRTWIEKDEKRAP